MSHVGKTSSPPSFPYSASSFPPFNTPKLHNSHKNCLLPALGLICSLRRTALQLLLDQLTGPSVRCPAERVFLGGLCSSLCQDRQYRRTISSLKWGRLGLLPAPSLLCWFYWAQHPRVGILLLFLFFFCCCCCSHVRKKCCVCFLADGQAPFLFVWAAVSAFIWPVDLLTWLKT